MKVFCRKKSQSLVEYSFILAMVGAVLVVMFTYMRRGIEGAVKGAADQMASDPMDPQRGHINSRKQSTTASTSTESSDSSTHTSISPGGQVTRSLNDTDTRMGTSTTTTSFNY